MVSNPNLTSTLFLRTVFWLPCIHGTWVAGGTFCSSVYSPLAFKYLSHADIKACIAA